MISGISKVVLTVEDQEKARTFWIDKVGFELATDEIYGNERWIEVRPPSGGPLVVLNKRHDDPAPVPEQLPTSNAFFACADLLSTYQELLDRGVRFPAPPSEQHFGWWSMFEDEEGNRFALVPES